MRASRQYTKTSRHQRTLSSCITRQESEVLLDSSDCSGPERRAKHTQKAEVEQASQPQVSQEQQHRSEQELSWTNLKVN